MRPLRFGINALYLIPGGVGGTEVYLRFLLAALAEVDAVNQYFVFTNRETGLDLAPAQANFVIRKQRVRAVSRPARLLWEQAALPLVAARLKLDAMLNPGFTAPLLCPCPQVTVFHDLQHKRHPEYFRWFELPFWRFFLFWSAHLSRSLVAISAATAADLQRFYRLPESKVRTAPHGVDPEFFALGGLRDPEPFLLAVSTLHPHKNLDGLLRAFAAFRSARPEFRLVVCGMHGFASGSLHELRETLGLRDAVDFPGWIPRSELYSLYARCSAFICPSLFEGFGLPILEALAAGIPSACSCIEPLSSIAGEAALQFDPREVASITDAMLRITGDEDLRRRLAQAGPKRAAQFSWRSAAEGTLDALVTAALAYER